MFAPFLEAGLVCVGNCCTFVAGAHGGSACGGGWLASYKAARKAHPCLPGGTAAERAWKDLTAWLFKEGVSAVRPEAIISACEFWNLAVKLGEKRSRPAGDPRAAVDFKAVEMVGRALAEDRVSIAAGGVARGRSDWKVMLVSCFGAFAPTPVQRDWAHGGRDRGRDAREAHVIYALGKKGEAAGREGGGARWLKRRDPDYIPGAPDDQARFQLGEDGCIEGWAAEAVKWKGSLSSDAEGFVCAGGRLGVGALPWRRRTAYRPQ